MHAYIDTIIPTFNTNIFFTAGIKLHITVFYQISILHVLILYSIHGFCVVWDILGVIL